MNSRHERLLDLLASLIAWFVVGFSVAAFLFIAFGVRILRPAWHHVSAWEFLIGCGVIGFAVALFTMRRDPGLK